MNISKAIEGQNKVVAFLKSRGFQIAEVNKPNTNGIDIVAIKNDKYFLIEVKTAIKSSRAYRINAPQPNCTIIAIVMPSGDIHFEQMKDWKKLSSKDGSQRITGLVSFFSA